MMERKRIRTREAEGGIALLISIFVLLLISVVAISLVVSSGTESALAGNYRSSTGVYYAAMAGLEEVRARLRPQSAISFKNTDATFLPAGGAPVAVCSPLYVTNPVGGENVAPWDSANPYYDAQFSQEFGGICAGPWPPNPSKSTLSIWNRNPLNGLPFPGPLYKWVRINGVSEQSLRLDVVPYDGTQTDTVPIYYDGTLNNNSLGKQVLEVTALAVLPNGSQKLVQYLVAPAPITLPPFPAALSLSGSPGSDPVFLPPASNNGYAVQGNDYNCNNIASPAPPTEAAIGIYGDYSGGSSSNAVTNAKAAIPPAARPNYTGQGGPPDVEPFQVSQTPSQLDAIVQTIVQNADVVLPAGPVSYPLPTVTGSALTPLGMTSSNPLTVVVNGNLDISNWSNDGYGLLLVIGNFTYDPDTNWNGIVLVIGQGVVNNTQNGQSKTILGAMFVAKTRDPTGNLVAPRIEGASMSFLPGMGGNGIHYSSCWIKAAQPTGSYQVLSFHEISQ